MKIWSGLPLAHKVFLACAGLSFGVAVASNAILYRDAQDSLRQEVREQLQTLAVTAALHVDSAYLPLLQSPKDAGKPEYHSLRRSLMAIREANPDIRHIYTLRKSRLDDRWRYVVDLHPNPERARPVGSDCNVGNTSLLDEALLVPTAGKDLRKDDQGYHLTALAPLKVRGGLVEGIIGMELPADELAKREAGLRHAAARNTVVSLVLALAVSLLVTRAMLRPVKIVTAAAERVRVGDLDYRLVLDGSREIRQFAETFNHMTSALKETYQSLLNQATQDVLTGTYNHMYLQERLAGEVDRAQRYDHDLCLMIMDLDRFKSINDTLGHPIGDSLLRQLAARIQENVRRIDVVARYGGDEFALLLPETGAESGLTVAENLRRTIEADAFYAVPLGDLIAEGMAHDDHRRINLTVTIGVAAFPTHHRTREGLVMAADIALCRAKHVRRNSVAAYENDTSGDGGPDPHELYEALHDPNTATIRSLAAAVDAKDRYTCGHSERVASCALEIGAALGLTDDLLGGLQVAGLLHDLGKIGVPDSILNKSGSLTTEEREAVCQHPSVAGNILKRAPALDSIIPAVLFHHERWDGAGYPDGLSGKDIPMMARVLAVADAFDAMISERPYRKPMSIEDALTELRANSGKQFDPEIVEAFVSRITASRLDNAA